jgi:hypothetical protein
MRRNYCKKGNNLKKNENVFFSSKKRVVEKYIKERRAYNN